MRRVCLHLAVALPAALLITVFLVSVVVSALIEPRSQRQSHNLQG